MKGLFLTDYFKVRKVIRLFPSVLGTRLCRMQVESAKDY